MDKFTAKLKNFISSIEIPSVELKNAIDYVIFPGGKRLRPQLVYLTGDLLKISHGSQNPNSHHCIMLNARGLITYTGLIYT